MFLERLELVDVRCYRHALLELVRGPSVIVGGNAQGKTNLMEALHYLAIGASHRVSNDAALVRVGAPAGVIRASARLQDARERRVEVELRPGGRNRARVDGQAQVRVRDALGLVRSVLFAPEDLQLIRGEPSDRRRFLDDLLGQRRRAYLTARQEYERVLRQRNALLRGQRGVRRAGPHGEGSDDAAVAATWTDALIRTGAVLLAARIAVVHALTGPAAAAYADLSGGSPPPGAAGGSRAPTDAPASTPPPITLAYELSTGRTVAGEPGSGVPDLADLAEELRAGLEELTSAERERGTTLAGPHRDELNLKIGGLPAKGYASHGEQWSLALALRLASHAVLYEVGEEPIVLLDDVFAELDVHRRERLAIRCEDFEQVVVTAAVEADVPLEGPRHWVEQGTVSSAGLA